MRNGVIFIVGLGLGILCGTVLATDQLLSRSPGPVTLGASPFEGLDPDLLIDWPADLPPPSFEMQLRPDPRGGANLVLDTTGFSFMPRAVNGEATPGTGHGHLYINGTRISRLYGPDLHLPQIEPGEVSVFISFSANDHRTWRVNGTPLFIEDTFQID